MSNKIDTSTSLGQAEAFLRETALGYPDAYEEFPWGERAFKVKGKVFLFLSRHSEGLNVTTKLPISGPTELSLPFASPTGYGLGKSGWVTARFESHDDIPVSLLSSWIDESYRAIAPKKLSAQLDAQHDRPVSPTAPNKSGLKKTRKPSAK